MKYILEQTIPSELDLANAIDDKYRKRSHGTVCIGTDFRPNNIDCWTVKKDANLDTEICSFEEFKQLFESEKIDLKKIKC
jgi:hypothetical protein